MTSGTQVVLNVDGETTERLDRVDRYLERVAALSPADWGRLDAAGQQLAASDPMAIWRRARRMSSMELMPPAAEGLMTVFIAVSDLVGRLVHALGGSDPARRTFAAHAGKPPNAEVDRMFAQIQRLYDIADAQPGGRRDAVHALAEGMLALHTRQARTPKSFRRAYAPVEPVIPAASLL
jgi:hypothetical protein